MKKVLLFIFVTMSLAWGNMQAKSSIYPAYGQWIGIYTLTQPGRSTTSGQLYYSNEYIKVKKNSIMVFDISNASFWNGCTNYTWFVNLPGGASDVHSQNLTVKFENTGYAVISVSALDKDGTRYKCASFMVYITD